MSSPARSAALEALRQYRQKGGKPEPYVAQTSAKLAENDRRLCMKLVYGVLQKLHWLDEALGACVNPRKTSPLVLDILRLGAYQLWFLERVPRYALVDESVALAKRRQPHAAGLVNAVLRRLPEAIPAPSSLSVRHSLPHFWLDRLRTQLDETELAQLLAYLDTEPPLLLQCHPGRWPGERPSYRGLDGCLELDNPAKLAPLLRQGRAIVADAGARLCVEALAPEPGELLWDCCAAPGGKSVMSAFRMGGRGRILATDSAASKLDALEQTVSALALPIISCCWADAAEARPEGLFDAVLCDVPCSGLGVLRRKPDIRYKDAADVARLPALQSRILANASRAVRPGGRLLYATCTLLREENHEVTERFLEAHPDFRREAFCVPIAGDAPEGELTLWPHRTLTDGFYLCRMRRA